MKRSGIRQVHRSRRSFTAGDGGDVGATVRFTRARRNSHEAHSRRACRRACRRCRRARIARLAAVHHEAGVPAACLVDKTVSRSVRIVPRIFADGGVGDNGPGELVQRICWRGGRPTWQWCGADGSLSPNIAPWPLGAPGVPPTVPGPVQSAWASPAASIPGPMTVTRGA